MTLTLSTQWQYNSYPSAIESNLKINRALSFQQVLFNGLWVEVCGPRVVCSAT